MKTIIRKVKKEIAELEIRAIYINSDMKLAQSFINDMPGTDKEIEHYKERLEETTRRIEELKEYLKEIK